MEVAKRSEVSQSTISRVEKAAFLADAAPRPTLLKIARGMGLQLIDLLGGESPERYSRRTGYRYPLDPPTEEARIQYEDLWANSSEPYACPGHQTSYDPPLYDHPDATRPPEPVAEQTRSQSLDDQAELLAFSRPGPYRHPLGDHLGIGATARFVRLGIAAAFDPERHAAEDAAAVCVLLEGRFVVDFHDLLGRLDSEEPDGDESELNRGWFDQVARSEADRQASRRVAVVHHPEGQRPAICAALLDAAATLRTEALEVNFPNMMLALAVRVSARANPDNSTQKT